MQKTVNYIASGLMVALIVLGFIDIVLIMMGSTNEFGVDVPNVTAINFGLGLFYFAFFATIAIALVSAVLHTLSNIKESVGTLAGIVIFVIILGISYSMAGAEMPEKWKIMAPDMFTASNSVIAETCLNVLYTFLVTSVLAIILGELFTLFKKYIVKY